MSVKVTPKNKIEGLYSVPGDKSVSHRAVMLSAICEGETEISGLLLGDDCLSTISCLRSLGVSIAIDENAERATVSGVGLWGLKKPNAPLCAGNSGTTIRLLSGILAAQPFETEITGDESLKSRPMQRVIEPLTQMGAKIESNAGKAPLKIVGNPHIKGISYDSKIASAQVKSCVLLAGLYAKGETSVSEPVKSRNHTEILLKHLGAAIKTGKNTATVTGGKSLRARPIRICGDISSAAWLITAALLLKNSDITITHVGVNLTRTGIITALLEMGAQIEVLNRRVLCGEPVADVHARSSALVGAEFGGSIIPRLIDEVPALAVAALFAEGKTVIRDAQELKVKESNRIDALAAELKKMNAKIEPTADGLIIEGGNILKGARVNSYGDHRIAMALSVAGLLAEGETYIEGGECASVSYPGFYDILNSIQ